MLTHVKAACRVLGRTVWHGLELQGWLADPTCPPPADIVNDYREGLDNAATRAERHWMRIEVRHMRASERAYKRWMRTEARRNALH